MGRSDSFQASGTSSLTGVCVSFLIGGRKVTAAVRTTLFLILDRVENCNLGCQRSAARSRIDCKEMRGGGYDKFVFCCCCCSGGEGGRILNLMILIKNSNNDNDMNNNECNNDGNDGDNSHINSSFNIFIIFIIANLLFIIYYYYHL